jgi:tetratricopeptide (TPR) repeat protein
LHEEVRKAISLRESGDPAAAESSLSTFLRKNPGDAEAHYQMAWCLDVRGMEREAIPHYRRALEIGLSGDDRSGAFLSLGSSLRAIGEYDEAVKTLRRGASEFPEDRAMEVFLAMALYNAGEHAESVGMLLENLAEATSDARIKSYGKAISFYADKLDEVWE